MINKNCLCYYNFFKFDLCPHKDKLVLHCIKEILTDFLSRNETCVKCKCGKTIEICVKNKLYNY